MEMRSALKLGAIALAIWLALEVYDEGVDGAFGGVFARQSAALDSPADRATSDRALDAFQRAYNKSELRVDRMLEEPGPAD